MSSYTGYVPPDHLVPTSEKMKDTWYRNTINYYTGLALSNKDSSILTREMEAFSGNINKKDYHYVLNPYNFSEERIQNMPGRLRNYDIIQPVWRRYMGEFSKTGNKFSVIAVNQDVENSYENGLIELVNGTLRQMVANTLNSQGIESGIESKDTPNIADQVRKDKMNQKETRAAIAQERFDFLKQSIDDESIRLRNYSDWINYGEFYTYRDIKNDDVYKEAVPIEEYYPIDNGKALVEDHDAGIRIRKMTIPQILQYFNNDLSITQLKYLRDLSVQYGAGKQSIKGSMIYGSVGVDGDVFANMQEGVAYGGTIIDPVKTYEFCDAQGYLEVVHNVYKTQVRTKILTYYNALGEELETEVSIGYKVDPSIGDISTAIIYVNRVYEQYRIGDEHAGLYLKPKELDVQRTDINDKNECKLPYNGRRRIFPGFPSHGIIKTMLPYQVFVNLLYLSRERAIAKNQGKVMTIPQSFINNDGNLTDDEKLYYMTADGKLYIDDSNPNFAAAVSALKSVETGDTEYILGLGALIEETKTAAREDVDMNRQRLGETYASDGKYTTEQALIRSSLGSAIINDIYGKTYEKDYEADLDYSKVAWINGKKGNYINSDKQVAFFEVNGIEHSETSYGIFVVNSTEEQEKLEALRSLAFSAGQNGDLVVAAEAIRTDSTAKLSSLIKDYDELIDTRKQNSEKAQQQSDQQVAQLNAETEQAKLDSAKEIAKYDGTIKLKLKEMDILIAELKIASEENRDGLKAQIEDKKLDLQAYIDSNENDVKENQKMLGLV